MWKRRNKIHPGKLAITFYDVHVGSRDAPIHLNQDIAALGDVHTVKIGGKHERFEKRVVLGSLYYPVRRPMGFYRPRIAALRKWAESVEAPVGRKSTNH
jgi:hypothetical protein